ncbi:MAG: hypothetical protein H6721_26070 [Sandaracinus sp.]|nr:hypothetical protein [Sandaracinus sp.]
MNRSGSNALVALGVFLFLALSPFVVIGIRGVWAELRLRDHGAEIDGEVLQVFDSDVRYRFFVDGRAYGHTDGTSREWLRTSLTPSAARRARLSRVVRVVYLPEDPQINRAVEAGASPLGDPLAAVCVFGAVAALGVVLVVSGIRRRRRIEPPKSF